MDDNTGDITCSPLTSDVFIVTVNPLNDPPVTIGDELSVLEGGTVTVTTLGASSVLIPAPREPNGLTRQRHLASRQLIGALRKPAVR